ncbi:MAG: DEAD/DEAH box helicase [Bacteroidota bacterium]
MSNFSSLGLSPSIIQAVQELGFEKPSDIQERSIPILSKGKVDFIGLAQTGTGKTAAFGLPLLDLIDTNIKKTQALVLAPTRELGQQIAKQFEDFGKYLPKVNIQVVYGGTSITKHLSDLRRTTPHIIVATPGRLIDLVKRRAINLESINHFILDEADEMLNMGFKEAIDEILTHTQGEKSIWLFSATMPGEIRRIIKEYMTDPEEVKINMANVVNTNIEHCYVMLRRDEKTEALMRIIDSNPDMLGIIFCRTKMDAQNLSSELSQKGYAMEAIHGDLTQAQRDRVMKRFKSHSVRLLAATDVAARGIDVNDLTHVIHFALPDDMEYYTHRSGRTARAGKKGLSIALATKGDVRKIESLQRKLKITINRTSLPKAKDIARTRLSRWSNDILTNSALHKQSDLVSEISMFFEDLSKEQLLEKLISYEIEKMGLKEDEPKPKASRSKSKEDSMPSGRKGSKNSNTVRFFINLGKIDAFEPNEVAEFVAGKSKVKAEDILSVDMSDRHSYFEIDKRFSSQVNTAFKDAMHDGRELRVNRDNGGPSTKRKKGGPSGRGGRRR